MLDELLHEECSHVTFYRRLCDEEGYSRSVCIGLFAVSAIGAGTEEHKATLGKDGKAVAVIVIAVNPTVSAQLGAKELQWHVQQITGAELPILKEGEKSTEGLVKLYIGNTQKVGEIGLGQAQFTKGARDQVDHGRPRVCRQGQGRSMFVGV